MAKVIIDNKEYCGVAVLRIGDTPEGVEVSMIAYQGNLGDVVLKDAKSIRIEAIGDVQTVLSNGSMFVHGCIENVERVKMAEVNGRIGTCSDRVMVKYDNKIKPNLSKAKVIHIDGELRILKVLAKEVKETIVQGNIQTIEEVNTLRLVGNVAHLR